MFSLDTIQMLLQGTGQTLYMTVISSVLSYIIGLPLGILLVITDKKGIHAIPVLNGFIGTIVNIIRSIPFIILVISIIPITRFIVGTTIGANATIVPLVLGSAPYIARLVESSLNEVDAGVIEAARSMGASTFKIVTKVLVPEARASLILGGAIGVTTILSYSALAGMVGGGGLGDIAIRYGYYRNQTAIAWLTVILLVVIVIICQEAGTRLAKYFDRRLTK